MRTLPFLYSASFALLTIACSLGTDRSLDPEHCAGQTGDLWCKEKYGEELFCSLHFPECNPAAMDGCEPQKPQASGCYIPCGMYSLTEYIPRECAWYSEDGSTTEVVQTSSGTSASTSSETSTSSASTDSESTGSESGESSSTGGVAVDCREHADCADPSTPACGGEGVCAACDAVSDGDAACAVNSEASPLCRDGVCVPCDENNANACPGETPVCEEFACVECTAEDSSSCSVARPVCFENACVPCTADDVGACANNAGQPVCFENACVACTAEDRGACTGVTPVCDTETHTCVPCTEHAQCESGVCNVDTGACFAAANVLVVDGGPGCSNNTEPFCRIGQAVLAIPEGQLTAVLVHALGGDAPYVESVMVDGARTALFVAATEDEPRIQGNGGPGLTVSGGATARLERLRFERGTHQGLLLTGEGSRADLDRCWVAQNTGGGISVTDGATLDLVNSFVSGVVDTDALSISGGTATIVYSTLAGRTVEGGSSRALTCDEASTVVARNSFFVATNDAEEVECDVASFSYSAAEMSLPGEGTILLGPLELTWFANIVQGDLHLNDPPNGLLRAAQWQPGDPTVDIDGERRLTTEGEMGVAGADVP